MSIEDVKDKINPSQSQWTTIYILIGYTIGIGIFWNMPYLRDILWPFKILTVALHEFGHASAGYMTGATVDSITLNPDEGGLTKMRGGNPYISLPAGYIGSTVWGSLMVFAGFNTTASKIVSVIVGVCMLLTLYWATNWLARIITFLFCGIIALLWWFEDGYYLRYFVLFVGIMSSLYSLWDIIEDLIVRKVNQSDASQFSKLCCGGCLPPQAWGLIWFMFSFVFLALAIFVALIVFKDP